MNIDSREEISLKIDYKLRLFFSSPSPPLFLKRKEDIYTTRLHDCPHNLIDNQRGKGYQGDFLERRH